MSESKCELCGEPMPEDEEMFKYHGYSGPCPKKPKLKHHQLRVVIEKKDLDKKIDKLTAFIDTETFSGLDEIEQERLVRQLHYMGHYTAVLGERIAAFTA